MDISAGWIWLERRCWLGVQDRYGPNRSGPFVAASGEYDQDFAKEDAPFRQAVFIHRPAKSVVTALLSYAVIPFAPGMW